MGKKYNLRCFHCQDYFKNQEEVFRDLQGFPLCEECFMDSILLDWEDPESILKTIKERFNGNYKAFRKWFFENHILCEGSKKGNHGHINWYIPEKDAIVLDDGKFYCELCAEEEGIF